MTPPTIVVLGGLNMDLIGVVDRLPEPGETISGEQFFTTPGGKGANQAVAAARMGARVKMVGRVGDDLFGPILRDGMRANGIDVSAVALDEANPTGVAMILLDATKENYIVAVYGANMACDAEQVRQVESALEGADWLMLQLEVPADVSLEAARAARRRGVPVVWDPAPPATMSADGYTALDIVTPNQREAAVLTGVEVDDVASAAKAAQALLDLGAPAAVVKLGEKGAYFASAESSGYVQAFEVEVVDTVAAGDAFAGALAVALAEGRNLKDAVRYGAAAGALAVTKPGAQEAMPTRADVDALVAAAGT